MFSVVDNYHSVNENTDLSINDLSNLLFAQVSKDHPYFQGVLQTLATLDVSALTTRELIKSLVTREQLKQISLAAYEVTEGRKTAEDLQTLLETYQKQPEETEDDENEFVTDDLDVLVDRTLKSPGLRWRLNTLNQMLGSLRKGNFGFVFARPETGKTTFLASEVTFMAEQLGPESGPILWLNNEQPGDEVMLRLYQASLGVDLTRLVANKQRAKEAFYKRTNSKLKVFDSGTIHKSTVEKLCRKYKPSLVVVDQLDAIKGFDADREDLKLGSIYQWARELSKEYCPFIAVCQADGTAEGVQWLNMGHVANAKTAKQAMADWILGIGKKNEPGYETIRFLHASKNKLLGDEDTDPAQRHGKREVLIEPHIGRYKDL